MEDFKLMYKILKVLLSCEDSTKWDPLLLDHNVLKVSERKRDNTLFRMQEEGLLCGVEEKSFIGDVEPKADISCERPRVTIKGIEFLETNSLMNKAGEELKEAAISFAAQTAANLMLKK